MKRAIFLEIKRILIFYITLFIFFPIPIHASAAKPAQDFKVSKAQIEALRDRAMRASQAWQAHPSEVSCAALEKSDDELYQKAQCCKELDPQCKARIEEGHRTLLLMLFHARSRLAKQMNEQRMSTGYFRIRDLNVPVCKHLPLSNRYRSLSDDIALAQEIYICPRTKPYAVRCNEHGWTELLVAFAKKDDRPLVATLAARAKQHADQNLHVKLKEKNARLASTVRCFVFRTPFEQEHRQLVQKVAALAPYTSLHYMHADEHAPLLIASVILDQDVYDRFAQENQLVHHPDVHVFTDEQAVAFLEYVQDVAQDNQRLKTKHITSDLAQFYKEHDEHQAKMQAVICASLASALPVLALQAQLNMYLTNEHPEPVHKVAPAALPFGAAHASVRK